MGMVCLHYDVKHLFLPVFKRLFLTICQNNHFIFVYVKINQRKNHLLLANDEKRKSNSVLFIGICGNLPVSINLGLTSLYV